MSKDKNKKVTESDPFKLLREKMQQDKVVLSVTPSIMEFVENKKYLGLPHKLFDLQKLVLKCFYRGSEGNKDLQLTEEDIEIIKKNNLDQIDKGNLIEKWNSDDEFRELVLVWGRRCLSEDTEIIEPKTGKLWRLGDLWNCGKEELDSWTLDQKTNKMTLISDCKLIYQGRREVYKIITVSGHEIEATDNHPLLTEDGWKQVRDLKPKVKIAIAGSQPFFGDQTGVAEEDASLLGYFSSSSFDLVGSSIVTTHKNGEALDDFCARLKEFKTEVNFIAPEERLLKTYDDRKYSYICDVKDNALISINSLLFTNGIKNKSPAQKFVPARIFTSTRKNIAIYLRSLFSADGNLTYNKSSKFVCKFEISFRNSVIAKQIQHLLSRFGIFATITPKYNKTHELFVLSVTKNKYVRALVQEISLCTHVEEAQEIAMNVEDSLDVDESVFSPIVSIKKTAIKRTFDLQVSDLPHLQNFVANGFVCHNSGKDYICSIVALYEAMRLLEIPGGDPYKIYNLGSATPFTILTIANSSAQAKILFREIKDKVLNSEYFRDKILPEGVTSDAIHFLTPEDKRRNEELVAKGFSPNLGSIVVRSGHSNSDTLVGISCYVLMLDEIGLYKNTAGASSGDAIFNSLAPAVKTYVREVPRLDKNQKQMLDSDGKPIVDKIYDGKIVCLSTPRGKEGIFYNLYKDHAEVNQRLMCQAATWQVNPMQSKEALMAAFPSMPEEKFRMEFGAEFSGTAGENFFPEQAVENCFGDKNLKLKDFGSVGCYYFAHLDPATSSHNYALVVAHKEVYFDKESGKKDWRILVDHIKYWSPSPNKPIQVDEVDDYVVDLNRRFCFGVVTYDHFNSQASIEKIRKKGVPSKMTPYTKRYKNIIYDNLYQIVVQNKLHIPNHLLLKNEMKYLQRKWLHSGYKVYPKRDGDVTTDDLVDALAGACYNCIEKEVDRLPQGKIVNSPQIGNSNIVWRSMQGVPYGIGSGQQVAKNMERGGSK